MHLNSLHYKSWPGTHITHRQYDIYDVNIDSGFDPPDVPWVGSSGRAPPQFASTSGLHISSSGRAAASSQTTAEPGAQREEWAVKTHNLTDRWTDTLHVRDVWVIPQEENKKNMTCFFSKTWVSRFLFKQIYIYHSLSNFSCLVVIIRYTPEERKLQNYVGCFLKTPHSWLSVCYSSCQRRWVYCFLVEERFQQAQSASKFSKHCNYRKTALINCKTLHHDSCKHTVL